MPYKKPRLLFVSTRSWPQIAPLVRAFDEAGFAVALVHTEHRVMPASRPGVQFYPAHLAQFRPTLEFAIRDVAPDLVIPTDAPAFADLGALHATGAVAIAAPIRRALGPVDRLARLSSPLGLQHFARDHDLPVPNAVEIADPAALRALLASVPLPLVLKGTGAATLLPAEIVRKPEAGLAAYDRLARTSGCAGRWFPKRLVRRPMPGPIAMQQYIDGIATRHFVAARDGAVLAGVSLEPLAGDGPAEVAKLIRHAAMADIAATLVTRLGLSGVIGFDYILEHLTRRAWLVAVKPYASPIAHLAALGEPGLAAALHRGFAAGPPARLRHSAGTATPLAAIR